MKQDKSDKVGYSAKPAKVRLEGSVSNLVLPVETGGRRRSRLKAGKNKSENACVLSSSLFSNLCFRSSNQFSVAIVWIALAIAVLTCQPLMASSDDVEEMPNAEPNNVNQNFEVAEANFDQWVYQGVGNAAAARDRMRARVKLKIDELDRICSLNDDQKLKLNLAARGDMKRFHDEVEVVRAKFNTVRRDQNAFNQIWQDIQPLQQKMSSGLFEEKSLYARTVHRILDDEQNIKYQAVVEERRRFKYRATVAVALTTLEKTNPLRHSQRQELMKLLVQETEPPQIFGTYDYHYVVYQLSHLPEDKVKPLLDENQWKSLTVHFEQIRNMEGMLMQQGILPKRERKRHGDHAPADALVPDNTQNRKVPPPGDDER